MLSREVIERPRTRALLRLAVYSLLAGALAGPMFLVGMRAAATVPLAEVIVVRQAAPPAPPLSCAAPTVRSTVARAAADAWLHDTAGLARSARIVPTLVDGRPQGFKLYAIKPGSAPAAIGLHNGDTITRVNGIELTSIDRAADVLATWSPATPTATIDLVRRGCPMTLTVTVV
ncbi:MAG TPA: PDZ domain-containing protein [Kofleriaceae bacterium]|nr:PDZ domain-containing protein [Kofleriaceae bacterium]